jgi:hypothetical protein
LEVESLVLNSAWLFISSQMFIQLLHISEPLMFLSAKEKEHCLPWSPLVEKMIWLKWSVSVKLFGTVRFLKGEWLLVYFWLGMNGQDTWTDWNVLRGRKKVDGW